MALTVATWNVLHRIHAVNWDEPALAAWRDERDRIASIADWLADADLDVVCLQEVSGDQLAMLRDVVPGELHAFAYPRVPAYGRRFEPPVLRDPTEHLVVLVRAGGATRVGASAFATDPGKGYLAVALADGTRVIATHVTYGDRRPAQLATLAATTAGAGAVIVCGDFNADRATCAAELDASLVAATPRAPALPTRPRASGAAKSQDIDHVFVRGHAIVEAAVADGEGRSDHNPVVARLA